MITSDCKKGWEIFPEVKCLAKNQDSDVKEKERVNVGPAVPGGEKRKLSAAGRWKSGLNVTDRFQNCLE